MSHGWAELRHPRCPFAKLQLRALRSSFGNAEHGGTQVEGSFLYFPHKRVAFLCRQKTHTQFTSSFKAHAYSSNKEGEAKTYPYGKRTRALGELDPFPELGSKPTHGDFEINFQKLRMPCWASKWENWYAPRYTFLERIVLHRIVPWRIPIFSFACPTWHSQFFTLFSSFLLHCVLTLLLLLLYAKPRVAVVLMYGILLSLR